VFWRRDTKGDSAATDTGRAGRKHTRYEVGRHAPEACGSVANNTHVWQGFEH